MKVALMLTGAIALGLLVWFSVAASADDLGGAGWYGLIALAFPVGLLTWFWREERHR